MEMISTTLAAAFGLGASFAVAYGATSLMIIAIDRMVKERNER
jgi:hypothetical protein